jgi:protein with PEP-CTERM/exosortase system signal
MKIKYLAGILIAITGLAPSTWAFTYLGEGTAGYAAHYTSTTDDRLVGTVIPGLQGQFGGQVERDVYMTNQLLSQSGQFGADGATYSSTGFSGPAATTTNALTSGGLGYSFPDGFTGPVVINLDNVGTFQYLVVAYDGPNSGAVVWNIAGLTGEIRFDAYGRPESGSGLNGLTGNLLGGNTAQQYRITSFTLINPTSAPDGGTTVMLLGAALGALGMVRRYLIG